MNAAKVIAKIDCETCHKHDVAVRPNFTLYSHSIYEHARCPGMSPEMVLTMVLRLAGLDGRDDAEDEITLDPKLERYWYGRQDEYGRMLLAEYPATVYPVTFSPESY